MMSRKDGGPAPPEKAGGDFSRSITLRRRAFLRSALVGVTGLVTGAQLSGCSNAAQPRASNTPTSIPAKAPIQASIQAPTQAPTQTASSVTKVLLVYFSRAGENYYYGGRTRLAVGNTEVMANMISRHIQCDVHRIEPVDPYPDDYEETVARNVREQSANARPAINQPLTSIALYDIVVLGSPIWNVRAPMIMTTFVERFDFTGKTVIPFVTYAVSGLGTVVRDYTAACRGAVIGEGLAVKGEEVQEANPTVESWLRRINLLRV